MEIALIYSLHGFSRRVRRRRAHRRHRDAAPITLPVGPLFIQYTNDEQFSLTNQSTAPMPDRSRHE